ncbi:glycosyltransferase family 2 protein [Enterococcus devriesei]|uniref:glycosyltransferase family 2 protein n=1 Tax=Enterococcus devriesei TaxID=319970 RepID=UPI00288EFF11|nr:glycosyltransferase family 2 protein [Enterococcus devriesei]MDT2822152.1 glycosyltransferase family 2 protein [Enterococcus devriesei]
MDKISIIIPVYNTCNYLERCFDSLKNQTHKNLEIIFVNDNSTDESLTFLKRFLYEDSRVKILSHDVNKGLSESRNTGIDNCTGEYLMYLDSDDYLKLNACEKLIEKANEFKLDLLLFQYDMEGWPNKKAIHFTNTLDVYTTNIINTVAPLILGELPEEIGQKKKIGFGACSFFIKRRCLINSKIRYISERSLIYEDYVFAINFIPNLKRIGVLDTGLYVYCHNAESLTNNFNVKNFKKFSKFVEYIIRNEKLVNTNTENNLRFKTTMLNYLRNLILQAYDSNISIFEIKKQLSERVIRDLMKDYPIKKMNKKNRIFFKLIYKNKIGNLILLKLLLKIK